VKVKASSTMTATSVTDAVGVGVAAVAIMFPTARIDGTTRAYVRDGVRMTAGTLTVLATDLVETLPVVYSASATSKVLGIGGASGTGIDAEATVSGTVEAFIGAHAGSAAGGAAGTTLSVAGTTTVTAIGKMTTDAKADGTNAGGATVALMFPTSLITGTLRAYLGAGSDLFTTTLNVTADMKQVDAESTTNVVGVAGLAGQGADASAAAQSTTSAFVDGSANVTGTLTLTAIDRDARALARTRGLSVGGLSISVVFPRANVGGTTSAYLGSNANVNAGSLIVSANATNNSNASAVCRPAASI